MDEDQFRDNGYRVRCGMGRWTLIHGEPWCGRIVKQGDAKDTDVGLTHWLSNLGPKDKQAMLEAAAADFVMRRIKR